MAGSSTDLRALERKKTDEKQILVAQDLISRDAKALGLIQGVVSDEIFPRIANQETAKDAWDVLKQEFKGDAQVMVVKLQGICKDFEYARMKNSEYLFDYLARLFALVNKMKMFGETLPNKRLVEKMLISLTPVYDNIVSVIEGTKKLDEIDPNEVVATLKGFEQRLKRHTEDEEVSDKAFSSHSIQNKNGSQTTGYKGKKPLKFRDKKGDFKANDRPQYATKPWFKGW
ncbi:uncharacterized protein [Pyrus communis]|uniref:uncharacterized protein n=1 Tax=Pyrus communis TaxID=23211 RepID=UPI0035BF2F1E